MPKYKAFLTMEFTADTVAKSEDEAREALRRCISHEEKSGYCNGASYDVKNIEVKRYWGGGNEILDDGTVVVR